MEEKRQHYRTAPSPLDLQVAVLDQHAQPHLATIRDLSGRGLGLALPVAALPPPKLGAPMRLRFFSRLLAAPLETVAVVLETGLTDTEQVLGLRFVDWLGLAAALPAGLAPVFNLRADYRFEVRAAPPVPVQVRGLEIAFAVEGTLRDISGGGLSFCAPPLAELALARTDRVLLDFALPEVAQPFSFVGRIRHRELVGESVRYGTWFETHNAKNSAQQQQALEAYIDRRCTAAIRELMPR